MSNRYTSGPPSYGNYRRSNSIDDEIETDSFEAPPAPTRSIVGARSREPRPVSERNLTDGESYFGQVPSISDMGRGGGMSSSGNRGLIHQNNAPNVDGHVRPNYSDPGQNNTSYGAHDQAPGMSGQARPNRSESGHQPSPAGPGPSQDYAGISLVGKKFKEVYPTAFYVEK